MKIRTDRKWKNLKDRYEVPVKVLAKEFDYLAEEEGTFFNYHNWWYSLDQFSTAHNIESLKGWDGYLNDSYCSGVVVKLSKDGEQYMVGTFCT